jgi:hypothetical protein
VEFPNKFKIRIKTGTFAGSNAFVNFVNGRYNVKADGLDVGYGKDNLNSIYNNKGFVIINQKWSYLKERLCSV